MQKRFIYILSFLLTVSITCNAIFQHRLEQTRQQLEYVRVELNRSKDNYRVIADGLGRTSEVLNQSANTVKELREQVSAIRETFEDMQNIIDSYNSGNDK